MLVESILICVEPSELVTSNVLARPIHRSILLMAEDNPNTGTAFSPSLAALTAYRLYFIAFQFSLAAGLAVDAQTLADFLPVEFPGINFTTPFANALPVYHPLGYRANIVLSVPQMLLESNS